MKAWHFVGETLRDGSPVPADGVTLRYDGDIALCCRGYHASKRAIDALTYAPGPVICRVELGGTIIHSGDKMVASERTILWRVEGSGLLRRFARKTAYGLIDLWDAPEVVVEYLKTGNEEIRSEAYSVARSVAYSTAWSAARSARS